MRILIIEDEVNLADALQHIMKKNKYEADAVYDGIKGEEKAMSGIYDIIVLDRMLPGIDGITLLKNIRKNNIKAPVIILTAKHSIEDKIEGLDAGADDYLVKPFSTDELLARIRAISRRNYDISENVEIILGKAKFMPRKGEILYGADFSEVINLTLKETGILELLSQSPNAAVTKEDILNRLWGPENDGDYNIVEVFISYLRKKIISEKCGFSISTVRRMGYKLKFNK